MEENIAEEDILGQNIVEEGFVEGNFLEEISIGEKTMDIISMTFEFGATSDQSRKCQKISLLNLGL